MKGKHRHPSNEVAKRTDPHHTPRHGKGIASRIARSGK